jgi:hypothetical protein
MNEGSSIYQWLIKRQRSRHTKCYDESNNPELASKTKDIHRHLSATIADPPHDIKVNGLTKCGWIYVSKFLLIELVRTCLVDVGVSGWINFLLRGSIQKGLDDLTVKGEIHDRTTRDKIKQDNLLRNWIVFRFILYYVLWTKDCLVF